MKSFLTEKVVGIIRCPSCGKVLEEYRYEIRMCKNTYTVFDLDEATEIVICNHCGFAGLQDQFSS